MPKKIENSVGAGRTCVSLDLADPDGAGGAWSETGGEGEGGQPWRARIFHGPSRLTVAKAFPAWSILRKLQIDCTSPESASA